MRDGHEHQRDRREEPVRARRRQFVEAHREWLDAYREQVEREGTFGATLRAFRMPMAQFDVHRNPEPATRDRVPYVVDLQSDLLADLQTRLGWSMQSTRYSAECEARRGYHAGRPTSMPDPTNTTAIIASLPRNGEATAPQFACQAGSAAARVHPSSSLRRVKRLHDGLR
jgi:hypothetical protein